MEKLQKNHCDKKQYVCQLCCNDKRLATSEAVKCKNISKFNAADSFECSECGITLEDWVEVKIDEEENDKSYCEYEFKYCPNCGKKIEGE